MNCTENPLFINIQGNNIAYYREGQGDTVIFIHGITTYSFIWRNIVSAFAKKHDVIVIDLLGCGLSDKPIHEDFSLKRQSTIVHDICQQLKISKLHLVCHDVGGGIGQIFAVNYPHLLNTLTLINSVAYNFWPVQPIIAMRTPIIRQIAMATLDFGIFELIVKRGLYNKSKLTHELMKFFWKPMNDALGRKAFLHFAKCLNNKNLTDIEEKIRELQIPTLIIRGEADVYLASVIAEKLHSEIPQSKLLKIQTAGHFIQEDEPEILSENILDFFKDITTFN